MLDGNAAVVGVAGRTLTELCGERDARLRAEEFTEFEVEDVEEALEWVWTWWMLRTDETDEEVDLRPRRPAEGRRYEECGVSGAGDREDRL